MSNEEPPKWLWILLVVGLLVLAAFVGGVPTQIEMLCCHP